MKSFFVIVVSVVLLLSVSVVAEAEAKRPSKQPNILFVLADDLGYGDLNVSGNKFVQTPSLDRFAKNCHWFKQAYAPAPQCSPTRGAILTGQYPARFHITTWIGGKEAAEYNGLLLPRQRKHLPKQTYTLAKYLQRAGYETIQIGKWHLGDDPQGPSQLGFDRTIGFAAGAGPGMPKQWFGPYPKIADLDGPSDEYITERLTDEAIALLGQKRDRPFFMMFQHYDPHAPLVAPPDEVQRYVDAGRPLDKGKLNATYLAMLQQVDTSFGRLLEALRKQGLYKNTVIIFYSDNGAANYYGRNAPLRGGKKEFYEGGIRVPLIMRVPGSTPRGIKHMVPVSGIDFFPTLIELTGGAVTEVDTPLDGVSLMPLIKGATELQRDTLYWHHPAVSKTFKPIPPQGAVREGAWKLIDFYGDTQPDELYNLDEDPKEENNIAAKHPEVVARLRAKLMAHLKQVDAQMVQPKPAGK